MSEQRVVLAVTQDEECHAFGKLLKNMGLQTASASTALDALALLEDYPPDLLIMDIELPDLHGWQMLAKLREIGELRRLPVIVITDWADFGTAVAGVQKLVRPVSMERLRRLVLESLDSPA